MTVCYFYGVAVPRHQSASHHIGFSQACPAPANNISSQIIFCDEKKPKYDFYSVHKSTLLYRWFSGNFGGRRKKSNLQRTNGTVKTFSSKGQLWPFLTASIFIFVNISFMKYLNSQFYEDFRNPRKLRFFDQLISFRQFFRYQLRGVATPGSLVGLLAGGGLISC